MFSNFFRFNLQTEAGNDACLLPFFSKKFWEQSAQTFFADKVATSLTAELKAYFERILKGREKEKGIKTKMRVIAWTLLKTMQPCKAGLLVIDELVQPRGR